MFKRAIASSLALIAALVAAAYFFNVRIGTGDPIAYRTLCKEKKAFHSFNALERRPAIQFREKVQKDIWFADGEERLHFLLKSRHSELTLIQRKDKVEAIEKLQQVDCWIQDEVDRAASIQQVRKITADEGIYYFPAHRFLAHSVQLGFFRLQGIELPKETPVQEKPFFYGTASEVRFAANDHLPTFTAYQLRAKLDPTRSCTKTLSGSSSGPFCDLSLVASSPMAPSAYANSSSSESSSKSPAKPDPLMVLVQLLRGLP